MSLDDRILLQRLGKQHNWELCFTYSPREAFGLASQSYFELILCDRNQPGYPWREAMDRLAECSPRSCILLVSPVRDDALWRNVLQQGGYDVLIRPLREESALHAVHAVLRLFPQSEVSLSVVGNNRTQLRRA
jgi:DNA-binding NarL/FixJ family response regulator